jgi:hypothetical protein
MTDYRTWLKGLLAAALFGMGGMASSVMLDPDHFNLQNLRHLELAALVGAISGVLGYLKQSPLVVPATVPIDKAGV